MHREGVCCANRSKPVDVFRRQFPAPLVLAIIKSRICAMVIEQENEIFNRWQVFHQQGEGKFEDRDS